MHRCSYLKMQVCPVASTDQISRTSIVIKSIGSSIVTRHPLPPVTIFPIFLCLPDFVSGMPVFLEIFCFALVIPVARFQESPHLPILRASRI